MIELRGKYNTAKVFTNNVEEKAISQIINLLNQEFVSGSKIRIMPDCLTEDAEVLTKTGFKLLRDVSIDDLIALYDDATGMVMFEKPMNIICRSVKSGEKIYRVSNKRGSFTMRVSENHRMAVVSDMGRKARDCAGLTTKDLVFNGEGLFTGDICDRYTDTELQLICWIVGDGNIKITHNNKTDNYRIRFEFSKLRKIERLRKLLQQEKVQYSENENIRAGKKDTVVFMLSTEGSRKWLELLHYKKTLPHDLLFLDRHQCNIVLQELIQIDGCYEMFLSGKGYRLSSVDTKSLDIVAGLVAINYGLSNLKELSKAKGLNVVPEASLKENPNGLHNSELTFVEDTEYVGELVCLEVRTSFFIARQFGSTFITGNCHAGAGCTIGTTMTITDKVVPNLVGVDIGCGMTCAMFENTNMVLEKLDTVIHNNVPAGFLIRGTVHPLISKIDLNALRCVEHVNMSRAELSLGTLGGGNHFIELSCDDAGRYYLIIHTGSRNLGKQVAEFYQDAAVKSLSDTSEQVRAVVAELKAQGRQSEIQDELKKINVRKVDKALAFCEGSLLDDYLHDMAIVQRYATLNRQAILTEITKTMAHNRVVESFTTIHNYIDIDARILRKGAVSAKAGEKLLIPINMRDGSLIGIGKGNADWNYSAPHGAGRLMSRSKAKEAITLEEYTDTMRGIYSTTVNHSTLDEAPMAYKPIDEIRANIVDTVDVIATLKPLYNFKAAE